MSETAFDSLNTSTNSALIVVTTAAEDERAGCLVGFHMQSGISPRRYCFWLSKANHTYRVSLRATHFAIHFLTAEDLDMAVLFGTRSGDDADKFVGLDLEPGQNGVPLISVLPNRMMLERISMLDDGGDHVCVTAQMRSAQTPGPFMPLRLSAAEHLVPGHSSEERAIHP